MKYALCAFYGFAAVLVASTIFASVKTGNANYLWLVALLFFFVPTESKS